MIQRVCTRCHTPLQFMANNTMAKCPLCHSTYFSDDIQHESEQQNAFIRSELLKGDAHLQEKRWGDALVVFSGLAKSYPLEIDVWTGLARALTREQTHFGLAGSEYALLIRALNKVQSLQGVLMDESWETYRTKYEQYRERQRLEIQEQCDTLAKWIDGQQDSAHKMVLRLVCVTFAFLLFVIGCVIAMIDSSLWVMTLLMGILAALVIAVIFRFTSRINLDASDREVVLTRCAEIQNQAEYWNVQIVFRQDIRHLLKSKK